MMNEAEYKSKCAYRVKEEFIKRYAYYVEKNHGLIEDEYPYEESMTQFVLKNPTHIKINLYPQRSERDPCDLRFNFTTTYKLCYEKDLYGRNWAPAPLTEERKRVDSRAYHGIFREELTANPDVIIRELRSRKINFVGLISYDGTMTRKEFQKELYDSKIWVVFIELVLNPIKKVFPTK